MQCTRCSSVMEVRPVRDVMIYECVGCRGLWVPKGQLVQWVQTLQVDRPEGTAVFQAVSNSSVADVPVMCAGCGGAMSSYEYACDSGVIVQKCSSCGAIWLDAEKIAAIGRHLKQSEPFISGSDQGPGRGVLLNSVEEMVERGGMLPEEICMFLGSLLADLLD